MTTAPTFQIDEPLSASKLAGLLTGEAAATLGAFIRAQRWFGSKTRRIAQVRLADFADRPAPTGRRFLDLFVQIDYDDGGDETFYFPIGVAKPEQLPAAIAERPERAVLGLETPSERFTVYDAAGDDEFLRRLVRQAGDAEIVLTQHGEINGRHIARPGPLIAATANDVRLLSGEQSNTSALIGGQFVLKVFRRLEPGTSPELDISRFLTERTSFRNSPALAGYVEYLPVGRNGAAPTLAIISQFIANQGDGWAYTLQQLRLALSHLSARAAPAVAATERSGALSSELLTAVRRLGAATANLHVALASDAEDPEFAPEPIVAGDVERWLGEMTTAARHRIEQVASAEDHQPPDIGRRLTALLNRTPSIERRFAALRDLPALGVHKIRIHGDYHLGQTLWTGGDFFLFDFEGEPAISLPERRQKRPALKDIAGMLRSFDYAAHAGAIDLAGGATVDPTVLARYRSGWRDAARSAFLSAYLGPIQRATVPLVPADHEATINLLRAFELEKGIYELAYEANNRPTWVGIPLDAIEAALGVA